MLGREELAHALCSRCGALTRPPDAMVLAGRILCGVCSEAVVRALQLSGLLEMDSRCGRCKREIAPRYKGQAERCWYCYAVLCGPCWDHHGHCGHAEAEALNRKMREAQE